MMRRIAVLTGGGDVPGLNPAIRAVTLAAHKAGIETIGLLGGWRALVAFNPDDPQDLARHTRKLLPDDIRGISAVGGTILRSSRTNPRRIGRKELPAHLSSQISDHKDADPSKTWDVTPSVLKNLEHLKIDAVIAIGGEDTLGYAEHLSRQGIEVMAIPKTMDNDVFGTEICLGFATCVARTVEYIHQLRTCCASHERFGVIEVMGRNSGATSLVPAYLAEADRALIAEVPFASDRLATLMQADRNSHAGRYALVTVSEGARPLAGEVLLQGEADAFGHKKLGGVGSLVAEQLTEHTGIKTIVQNLGYLVRSGTPDAVDIMAGQAFGSMAIEELVGGRCNQMVAVEKGCYTTVPLHAVAQGQRPLDVAHWYDEKTYSPRPKSFRHRPLYLS